MSDFGLLQKACDCKDASASGPRPVIDSAVQTDEGTTFRFVLVRLACDKCDTPWKEFSLRKLP